MLAKRRTAVGIFEPEAVATKQARQYKERALPELNPMTDRIRDIPKVVVLIETAWEYGRGFLRGIAKYARLHSPWALYLEPEGQERIALQYDKWGANGIIVQIDDLNRAKKLIPTGLPAIAFLRPADIPELPCIVGDWDTTGKLGAEHLLERGFKNFAYCGYKNEWARRRAEGYKKRLAKAGYETFYSQQPREKVRLSWQKEQSLMAKWLQSLPKPIGIMACDDEHSRDVIEACKIAGLQVPDQVAIIGVDNDDLICNMSYPRLSSIALNTEKAGYEAAELLDRLMAGEPMKGQTVIVEPLYVVPRESTDIFAMQEQNLAKAVRFIRDRARQMVQVTDVVRAVPVSRRVLERKFRQVLGRSILDEIRRVRTQQVVQMLIETNLSVSQIARTLNFPGPEHIARYFRKQTGMSPLEYRNKHAIK